MDKPDNNKKKKKRQTPLSAKKTEKQLSDKFNDSPTGNKNTDIMNTPVVKTGNEFYRPSTSSASPDSAQSMLTVTEIIKAVFRHKFIMLAIFILVATPALLLIWTQSQLKYKAKAQVRIRPIIPYLVFQTEDNGAVPFYDSYVLTQCSIMRTDEVLQRVLDRREIQQLQWYQDPSRSTIDKITGNQVTKIDRLKEALSIDYKEGTEIIEVAFDDLIAEDAQTIVNTIVAQYMAYTMELSDETQDQIYRQLTEEYQSLEREIQGREEVIAELRQRLGTSIPEELISGQRIRLDNTEATIGQLKQNIKILEWEISKLTATDSNDSNSPALDEDQMKQLFYYSDSQWLQQQINVETLKQAIENSPYIEENKNYSRMVRELELAEDLLKKRQEQLDFQFEYRSENVAGLPAISDSTQTNSEQNLVLLKYELEKSQYEQQLLNEQLQSQQTIFDELFTSAQLLERENTTIENKRELFDAVRERLEQKEMESNVVGSIEILAEASVPSMPYNDNRIRNSVMALLFALGTGGVAAFLKDTKNTLVHSPKDLPYLMRRPFLGYIPDIKSNIFAENDTDSDIYEAVRLIRTALLSRLNRGCCNTILITSSRTKTGTTSVTWLLAKSLAQAGKSVLIIDADLHKRTLTDQFQNVPEQTGLIQALHSDSDYDQHILGTWIPGLNIVTAGHREKGDIALDEIADGAFRSFINHMCNQYDFILIDSAPIIPLADTAILASQLDGTIMVERERLTRRNDTIAALARLGSAGGRLLGTVIVGSENLN